jgi:uncharacterized protein (DUF362 family)
MFKKINRRSFVKKTALFSAAALSGIDLIAKDENTPYDVAIVSGKDYLNNTKQAVNLIGGIHRFVPPKSKVAILPNPSNFLPGTFSKPEILRAVIQLCKEAGASDIACIGWLPYRNWRLTGQTIVIEEEGARLEITEEGNEKLYREIPVPNSKYLKKAKIIDTFFKYDVLINLNISKEHSGNNLSATMKNLMGLNSAESDRTFHRKKWNMITEDIEYLDQCIADLNTVITPDLNITDSTEFITTNGPMGPGKILRPQKIIAGIDRVAMDTYCASLLGYHTENITFLNAAHRHGLGEINLNRVRIKEMVGRG